MKVLQLSPLTLKHGLATRAKQFNNALKELSYSVEFSQLAEKRVFCFVVLFLEQTFMTCFGNYDICLVHKLLPHSLAYVCIAKLRGKQAIIDCDDYEAGFHESCFIKILLLLFDKLHTIFQPIVTTHSDKILKHLSDQGFKKVYFIPQTIDQAFFKDVDKEKVLSIKKKYGLQNKQTYVYVASFTKGGLNDFKNVIELYEKEKKKKDSVLLMIGGGPLESSVRKDFLNQKDIVFTGHVANKDVVDYLDAADSCLIYMSDTSVNNARVSLKLMEYLAREKVIVGKVFGESKDLKSVHAFRKNNETMRETLKTLIEQ